MGLGRTPSGQGASAVIVRDGATLGKRRDVGHTVRILYRPLLARMLNRQWLFARVVVLILDNNLQVCRLAYPSLWLY